MLEGMARTMHARSAALLDSIESSLDRIMYCWLLLAGLAAALRIALSPIPAGLQPATVTPYLLLIFAPLGSMLLALRWFADVGSQPQPMLRLARIGAWRPVGRLEAMRHPLYGTGGIMVSLLIGMLLNVPVRAMEYLAAMPALSGPVPAWLATLHMMMTLDVVLLSSLYTIAFVAALRRIPSFPRLLVAIWLLDLAMQLFTAQMVAGMPGLPRDVVANRVPLVAQPPADKLEVLEVDDVEQKPRDIQQRKQGPQHLLPGPRPHRHQQREQHQRQVQPQQRRHVEPQPVHEGQRHRPRPNRPERGQVEQVKAQPQQRIRRHQQRKAAQQQANGRGREQGS